MARLIDVFQFWRMKQEVIVFIFEEFTKRVLEIIRNNSISIVWIQKGQQQHTERGELPILYLTAIYIIYYMAFLCRCCERQADYMATEHNL